MTIGVSTGGLTGEESDCQRLTTGEKMTDRSPRKVLNCSDKTQF